MVAKALDRGADDLTGDRPTKAVDGGAPANEHAHDHHQSEVEVLSVSVTGHPADAAVDVDALTTGLLSSAPKDEVYRIKGVVRADRAPRDGPSSSSSSSSFSSSSPATDRDGRSNDPATRRPQTYLLNWAFGRWTWTEAPALHDANAPAARLTLVLARDESTRWKSKLESGGPLRLASGEGVLAVQKVG
ncbi:hypothetical protein VTO42DRAFT_4899 [Malbranchea cinnamomea]